MLEKKNRRLQVFNIGILFLLATTLLIGWQPTHQFFDEIKTNKLTIVDKNQKDRLVMFLDEDFMKIRFYNTEGKQSMTLGCKMEGYISIFSENERSSINPYGFLVFNENGYSHIEPKGFFVENYVEKDTVESIAIYNNDGKPNMYFKAPNNNLRFYINTSGLEDEVSMHFFRDQIKRKDGIVADPVINGNWFSKVTPTLSFCSKEDGDAFINIYDKTYHRRITLGSFTDNKTSISIFDSQENIRSNFGTAQTQDRNGIKSNYPESSIFLFNASGNVIYQAPQ